MKESGRGEVEEDLLEELSGVLVCVGWRDDVGLFIPRLGGSPGLMAVSLGTALWTLESALLVR